MRRIKKYVALLLLPVIVSCTGNSLETFSDTTTDDALFYSALKALELRNFTSAIDSCTYMSADYLTDRRVAVVCASAFAGRCGIEVLNEVTFLTTYAALGVPPPIFEYYMSQLSTTTAQKMTDCQTAEEILRSIGAASSRTADENLFMVLLALHKIGVYANELSDIDEDGVLDGAFDACAMSDTDATDVMSAFWEMKQSSSVMTGSYFTLISTAVTQVCAGLEAFNPAYNFCSATTLPTAPTANQLKGARTILHEGTLTGVNSCGAGVPSIANCGCP